MPATLFAGLVVVRHQVCRDLGHMGLSLVVSAPLEVVVCQTLPLQVKVGERTDIERKIHNRADP